MDFDDISSALCNFRFLRDFEGTRVCVFIYICVCIDGETILQLTIFLQSSKKTSFLIIINFETESYSSNTLKTMSWMFIQYRSIIT